MDVAVGEGEYLAALMDVVDCDQTVQAALIDDMRENLGETVTRADYAAMTEADKAREMYVDMYSTISVKYAANCAPVE